MGLDIFKKGNSKREKAIQSLRNSIIEHITKFESRTYELECLLGKSAAKCFPNDKIQWYGAWFELNLVTMELHAQVATYPNQFGACREDKFLLSTSEFHKIATKFRFAKELRVFRCDEDWQQLFDDKLKIAIKDAIIKLEKKEEDAEQKNRAQSAITIPPHFKLMEPCMEFTEIVLELKQRYSCSKVSITRKENKYQIQYIGDKRCENDLSPWEATYIEQMILQTLNDSDETTWRSLPGGDTMTVKIQKQQNVIVNVQHDPPLQKYYELKFLLGKLAQYGSYIDGEPRV